MPAIHLPGSPPSSWQLLSQSPMATSLGQLLNLPKPVPVQLRSYYPSHGVVRIQCVTFLSPHHSAGGDMHKYWPTTVSQAGKSQPCWGVGAGVHFVAAGRWGSPGESWRRVGVDRVMGTLVSFRELGIASMTSFNTVNNAYDCTAESWLMFSWYLLMSSLEPCTCPWNTS